MGNELKKLMLRQKGLFFVLLIIAVKCVALCLDGYDSYYTIDIYESAYKSYIRQFEGRLNEEKQKAIQEEYNAVNHASMKLSSIKEELEAGKICTEDYKQLYREYYEKKQNSDIFTVIYAKYKYALSNTQFHYILDTRGWETLLSHDSEDFLLILFVIIMTAFIFSTEYECGMELILLTSRNGKYKTGWEKLLLNCFMAAGITVCFQQMKFSYLSITVGLPHASYPLQSLPFFENSSYHITLGEAYLIVTLLRILGAVFLSVGMSLLALFWHTKVSVLILGGAFMIVPAVALSGKDIMYYLPFPTGLLKATGYLWESKYSYSYNDNFESVKVCTFHEIPKNYLLILIMVVIIFILAGMLLYMKCYSHNTFRMLFQKLFKQKKVQNHIITFAIMLGIGCMLIGCTRAEKNVEYIYNAQNRFDWLPFQGGKVRFHQDELAIEIRKDGKEPYILKNSELEGNEDTYIISICVYEDSCYSMEVNQDNTCKIYQTSLKDLKKQLIYTSERENTEDFFGLYNKEEINSEWYAKIVCEYSNFFVNENYIYLVENHSLRQINRKTKWEKTVITDLADAEELCYHNGDIYYLSMKGTVSLYSEKKKEIKELSIYGENLSLSQTGLSYDDVLEEGKRKTYCISP